MKKTANGIFYLNWEGVAEWEYENWTEINPFHIAPEYKNEESSFKTD